MQLNSILKFVIATIFILLGGYHLINAQTIQYDLISCGISNWVFSLLLYYLLVSLEITFGVLLLFNKGSKFIKIPLIIYLAIISIFTIISGITTNFILHYNYWGNALLPFALIVLIFGTQKIIYVTKTRNWVILVSFFTFFGISFAFNPIYVEDYMNTTPLSHIYPQIESDVVSFLEKKKALNSKYTFVSFLSTSCHSCVEMAKKLYTAHLNSDETKLLFIFSDTEDNIHLFLEYLHINNVDYLNIQEGKFSYLCQSRTPFSYFIENNAVTGRWTTYDLTYFDLDKIF